MTSVWGSLFLHPVRRVGEWVLIGVGTYIAYNAAMSWPLWPSHIDVVVGELFCEPGSGRYDAGTCAVRGEKFDLAFLGIPERQLREVSFLQAEVTVLRIEARAPMLADQLLGISIGGQQVIVPSRAYAVRVFETFAIALFAAMFFGVACSSLRSERTLLEALKTRQREGRTHDRP